MTPALSSRDRRALSLGALALAPALAWTALIQPYRRWHDEAADAVRVERDSLLHEVALIRSAEANVRVLERGLARLLAFTPRVFVAEDGRSATAAMGEFIWDQARVSHVLVSDIQALPSDTIGPGLTIVPLRVQGEGDLEGILRLLAGMGAGSKLITVGALKIEARRPGAATADDGWERLAFAFTASGFALAGLDSGATAHAEAGTR